jgi:aminocarboxymuconate-semialdehyde decarboxylase
MDEQGVDVQALTINGFWWYTAADRGLADRIVRAQNEGLAKWVAQHPDRFGAMASVALQHSEQAAAHLEDGVKRPGLRGASIGGHVNGEDLSLPKYDPFWAKAAELGVSRGDASAGLVGKHDQSRGYLDRVGTYRAAGENE